MKKNIKRKQAKGFTLVELLAVIVILAIILVIAVPKIMSVIEDSKKASLESTAKMIASTAEKQKVQNTVLGKEEEITCDNVAQINKTDYASCRIEFEEDTAKVTITGAGKFDGFWVCNGDKTSAEATREECLLEYGNGSTYISKLLEKENELNNGLIVDDTEDKNIRYRGADPNNKVYFNCKDIYNGVSYGSEGYDYASACEIWRIIGIFNVKTNVNDTKGKNRIKIARDVFSDSEGNILKMSWDSSASTVNKGNGINQWGESKYEDGTFYEGADLMRMLNTYYLGTSNSTCTYCNTASNSECSNDCSSIITPLSINAQNMIDQAVWSTRAIDYAQLDEEKIIELYNLEKTSNLTGKECASLGIELCNDKVTRMLEWEGKIGLIYLSDWGYASADKECLNLSVIESGTCYKTNWLYKSLEWYWTISSISRGEGATAGAVSVWDIIGFAGGHTANYASGVRPSTYLSSDIEIIGGNGGNEPFILK